MPLHTISDVTFLNNNAQLSFLNCDFCGVSEWKNYLYFPSYCDCDTSLPRRFIRSIVLYSNFLFYNLFSCSFYSLLLSFKMQCQVYLKYFIMWAKTCVKGFLNVYMYVQPFTGNMSVVRLLCQSIIYPV